MEFYSRLKEIIKKLSSGMEHENVELISARTLTPKEAIGCPEGDEYPLVKGKEVMVEAVFKGAKGQAFTDRPVCFKGNLSDVLGLSLNNSSERAIFIACLNALMRSLGLIKGTIHCKDKEPTHCAEDLVQKVKIRFGKPRIAFVGFQPAMIKELSCSFPIRVVDLDEENIGTRKFNTFIEGPSATQEILAWGDVVLATGSTCVNGTIMQFLREKPVIFYGVSVAGVAKILGLKRYCPYGH